MKKYFIIQIIIWAIVALMLFAVLLCGLNGGLDFLRNTTFNIGVSTYNYENSELYSSDLNESVIAGMKIDTIIIDWISGDVIIKTDSGSFKFYEECRSTPEENQKLHWMLDGSTLYIRYCGAGSEFKLFNSMPSKNLYVCIPESTSDMIKKLEINTISAPVDIVGGLYKDIIIGTVSGNATLRCSFESINSKSVSGKLDAYSDDCPARVHAESVSGQLMLTLAENRSFTVSYDTVSGGFFSDIDTVSSGKHMIKHVNDNYNKSFNADFNFHTVSGNISVNKGADFTG